MIPGLGFAWGVALGAIISPTDAVATSIVKGTPVSQRVVALLEGESLLNDATALVLLRTAIAATALSFSFWDALGTFAYSVVVAAAIGWVVGNLNLLVRRRIAEPPVNTVVSFAVPFVAAVPTGLLGASGLVAAVVAGLVIGYRAPRDLSPQNRMSDQQNWRTVELVLESAVFLAMGLQLRSVVTAVDRVHAGLGGAVAVAVGALALTVLARACYVGPLLWALALRSRSATKLRTRIEDMQDKLSTPEGKATTLAEFNAGRRFGRKRTEGDLDRFAVRLRRGMATVAYFLREPLGWRDGTAVVWAGMRGAVTVAAAQTLPADAPQRSVLVFVAFAVAGLSLLCQGGTLGLLLARVGRHVDPAVVEERRRAERDRLFALMRSSSETVPAPPETGGQRTDADFRTAKTYRLAVLAAQRAALLEARDDGTFDAAVLEDALANLDASQIDLELRGRLAA